MHFSASSWNAFAVIAIIGIVFASECSNDLIFFVAVYPSITGIIRSIRIASNVPAGFSLNNFTACCPSSTRVINAPTSSRTVFAISAFSSLSSTRRILVPFIVWIAGGFMAFWFPYTSSFDAMSKERSTVNFVPMPCLLSTWILPSISSIMDLIIESPSPVPCTLFSVVVCSLENSS